MEVDMPHPHLLLSACGALYSATPSLVPKSEGDTAKCVVCLKIMDRLDTAKVPNFKLIQRPEDA
jgi:hypothetical protein